MFKSFFVESTPERSITPRLAFYQALIAQINHKLNLDLKVENQPVGLSSKQKFGIGLSLAAGLLNTFCESFGNASVLLTTLIDAPHLAYYLLGATVLFSLTSLVMYLMHQMVVLSNDYDMPFGFVSVQKNNFDHEQAYLEVLKNFLLQHSFRKNPVFTEKEWEEIKTKLTDYLKQAQTEYDAMITSNQCARQHWLFCCLRSLLVLGLASWSVINGFMLGFFSLSMLMFLIPTVTVPLSVCFVLGAFTALSSFVLFYFEMHEEINLTCDRLYPTEATSLYTDVQRSLECIKIYQDQSTQYEIPQIACA